MMRTWDRVEKALVGVLGLAALAFALWQENVSAYRANMATAQSRARELAQSHGISIVEPSPDELEAKRRVMMIYQGQVAKQSSISPEMLATIAADLSAAD